MATSKNLQIVIQCLILITAIAVLAISIATVVKVYDNDDDKESTSATVVPSVTTNAVSNTATNVVPSVTTNAVSNTATNVVPSVTTNAVSNTTTNVVPSVTTNAVSSTTQVPFVQHTNQPIDPSDHRFEAYKTAADRFLSLIDTSVDPCTDFYNYTCRLMTDDSSMSFDDVQLRALSIMLQNFNNDTYRASQTINPMKQLFHYYDTCKTTTTDYENNSYVLNLINDYKQAAGVSFPLFDGYSEVSMPDKTQLAKAIGYLAGRHDISTFISPFVDTNWGRPTSGYSLFFDEATLMEENTYYNKINDFRQSLIEFLTESLSSLLSLDQQILQRDVEDVVDMEFAIAANYSSTEEEKRRFAPQFNVYTLSEVSDAYDYLDWQALVANVVFYGNSNVKQMITDPNFKIVITNTSYMNQLRDIVNGNVFTPRTILNYLSIRLIYKYTSFIEMSLKSVKNTVTKFHRPMVGKPRYLRAPRPPIPKRVSVSKNYDLDFTTANCLYSTVVNFQYANARLFVNAKYPRQEDRDKLRVDVGRLANNIIASFRGMIDQLNWMDSSSKLGAYDKMNNLVRNIGFPDFVLDDQQLTDYYDDLSITEEDNLVQIEQKLFEFDMKKMINSLNESAVKRDDFNGPPGLVNAWYQPEVNSITFPAAILDQPFYDPQWPASVIYGAFGVVAGHELTHGFDDEGVQWDGTGRLYQWMSDTSSQNFSGMAHCVISEYSHFCPPFLEICVDGAQTQGENIADNGGIHASYRAYKNYANLNGQDPAFNHPILSRLTHDQLFFMGFAQVWCDQPSNALGSERQLLVDPHSPSYYRVFGTIQNFPAFKNAFNCPSNTTYAPNSHCDVWVSDLDTFSGIPEESDTDSEVHVPLPPSLPRNDSRYTSYSQAISMLKYSMNLSADPCTDFYEYSCGSYKKPLSFTILRNNNYRHIAEEMEKSEYSTSQVKILKETIKFYKTCKNARIDYAAAKGNGTAIKNLMEEFSATTGLKFSMMINVTEQQQLSPTVLGRAVGMLSTLGVDTLIAPIVDTDWKKPSEYRLFIDQNVLYYDKSYYEEKAWNTVKEAHKKNTLNLLKNYAAVLNVSISDNVHNENIEKLFNIELDLARNYSTDETTRRQYERSYKMFSHYQGTITFIDLDSYLKGLSQNLWTNWPNDLTTIKSNMLIMEPKMIAKLSNDFSSKFNSEEIINYLFYRLLAEYEDFLPQRPGHENVPIKMGEEHFGRSRKRKIPSPRQIGQEVSLEIKEQCAYETLTLLQYANARFFANYLYPNEDDRKAMEMAVSDMISNIKNAFDGMMRQTLQNDTMSIKGASDKITNLYQNIAFPPWIFDDRQLDKYYDEVSLDESLDYFAMRRKLLFVNYKMSVQKLINSSVDRNEFNGPPATANAWYLPELNSITFPAGILMQPFFDPNWPTSLNYGGLGVVAGHELSHGFDDEGIQWTGNGTLQTWMQPQSEALFNESAQCIIQEYHSFCPLNGTGKQPECLNGENTQGENIADNGGIHAAWNSYRNLVALRGLEPRLPDKAFGQLTHDQLFFLGFAQVWCQATPSDDAIYKQIMVDPHSPSKYRVLGTVQNFPAFRNAFNCPKESDADRQKHCSVWVPKM